MKKYFIAVAALALLAACSGKKTTEPVIIEEESVAVAESVPDAPALPVISDAKAKVNKTDKAAKPVNMRDSLKVDPKKGSVIQKKYKGTFPAADGPGIDYDLVLFYQQDSDDGVYEMDATYLEAEDGQNQTFSSTGKRKVKKGTPSNSEAIVYELIPSDGTMTYYFLAEGDSLTLLTQDLQKAASGLNYTLMLVQ
ncbi:MAG: copper resistance protein NlpE [Parabacteroides sp.]|nr:copper resistance protein NlpE [Parabacteroides sp.]